MPTRALGLPQSTETDWRPDKKFRPDFEAGGLRTNNRLPSCHWLKVGRGSLRLLWVRVGVSRAWPEGVGLVFCLPFCCCERGARSAPCCCSHSLCCSWLFRSGGGFVFWFFCAFVQSLIHLSMQLFSVSPTQFLCSSLLEERFVLV